MNEHEDLGRIRWKCRRGMLELDLMLLKFIEHDYVSLSDAEKHIFELLLDEPDPVLQDYLYGLALPGNPQVSGLIKKIRKK